jgi:hypothetical protein
MQERTDHSRYAVGDPELMNSSQEKAEIVFRPVCRRRKTSVVETVHPTSISSTDAVAVFCGNLTSLARRQIQRLLLDRSIPLSPFTTLQLRMLRAVLDPGRTV